MKVKNIIFTGILYSLSAVCILGCNNAEYKEKANMAYLLDATGSAKASTIVIEDGADIALTVRLAQKTTQDVTIAVGFNPDNIDTYNKLNGTEYQSLPTELLPTDVHITIPAGSISASYTLHIDDFESNEITYAIPVQLGRVIQGDFQVSVGQGQYIYVLSKPLITSVPVMRGYTNQMVQTTWETPVTSDAITIEAWLKMSGYSVNNQAIFDGNHIPHNIYIRFGDANRPYNYMQANIHNGTVETTKTLEKETWYHWAYVYDGTNFYMYQDGVLVDFVESQNKGPITIEYLKMISSGTRYFKDDCSMSQVRIWSVARTQTEIQANMFNKVNPKNPNLIAYWPMDEASGNKFTDITGNGHDAVADKNILRRWDHNIRFDK